ncbi:MAG: zinc ABC transporter substrate-binding protein [Azospirillaceae bacterium]
MPAVRPALLPTILLSALLAGTSPAPGQQAPAVVVSVAPLHGITAAVMAGAGEPDLLIDGGQSPHTFTMRPSQAAMLQSADLVVWGGRLLESTLERPLESLVPAEARFSVLDAPGLLLLEARGGGVWASHEHDLAPHDDDDGHHDQDDHEAHSDEHDHDEAHDHDDEHDHSEDHAGDDHGATDAHLWLDPDNAVAIARAIAERLAEIDPANADIYRANAERFSDETAVLTADLTERLSALADRPFIVFHDAYQYLETRFDLDAAGSIAVSPDSQPSASRIVEIQDTITARGALCLFAEPQFEPTIVESIAGDTGVRTGILDPVGGDLALGPGHYERLMRGLADGLEDCLGD